MHVVINTKLSRLLEYMKMLALTLVSEAAVQRIHHLTFRIPHFDRSYRLAGLRDGEWSSKSPGNEEKAESSETHLEYLFSECQTCLLEIWSELCNT